MQMLALNIARKTRKRYSYRLASAQAHKVILVHEHEVHGGHDHVLLRLERPLVGLEKGFKTLHRVLRCVDGSKNRLLRMLIADHQQG